MDIIRYVYYQTLQYSNIITTNNIRFIKGVFIFNCCLFVFSVSFKAIDFSNILYLIIYILIELTKATKVNSRGSETLILKGQKKQVNLQSNKLNLLMRHLVSFELSKATKVNSRGSETLILKGQKKQLNLQGKKVKLLRRSEFKLQSCYYIHFQTNNLGKCMNFFILLSYELNSTITIIFYKDGFGIKETTKVDMPFKKETKPIFILLKIY